MLIDVLSSVQDPTFVTNYIHWVRLVERILLLLQSVNNVNLLKLVLACCCLCKSACC
jgi:hypothetical protein